MTAFQSQSDGVRGLPSGEPEDAPTGPKSFRESQLYHTWYDRVAAGTPNDYLILISAHPGRTSTSGVGKSTLGAWLASQFHTAGEWSVEDNYTLDIKQYAYETLPSSDEGSAIFGDEMQGTVANTNLNKMRTTKNEQLKALAAIAGDRKNRKTKIMVFQTLSRVNSYLFDYVDSWLLIVDDRNYVANHYKVMPKGTFDLQSSSGLKTPRVESITWPSISHDNDKYRQMEQLKEQANAGEGEFTEASEKESEKAIPKSIRDKKICELYDKGVAQTDLADSFDLTQQAVSEIVNNNL